MNREREEALRTLRVEAILARHGIHSKRRHAKAHTQIPSDGQVVHRRLGFVKRTY